MLGNQFQIMIGAVLSLLLVYLFVNSQIDTDSYNANTTLLLRLQEQDSTLNRIIAQVESGQVKSFEPFTKTEVKISALMSRIKKLPEPLPEDSGKRLQIIIHDLQQLFLSKFEKIEDFKTRTAVLNLSRGFFPKLSRDIIFKSGRSGLGDDQQQQLVQQVQRLVKAVLLHAFGRMDNAERVITIIRFMDEKYRDLPGDLSADLQQLLSYSQKIVTQTTAIAQSSRLLQKIPTSDYLHRLYSVYQSEFNKMNSEAQTSRRFLFSIAMLLVVYLAFTFFRLQRMNRDMQAVNTYLQFQQFALDEHAIVSITDVKGNIIYANQKFCEISQYSEDELIGENHRIIKSDAHSDFFFQDLWKTIANGRVWHGVICNKARDGSLYWVESTIVPHLNEQGKPFEYIGIRTDITKQILAEKEIDALAQLPEENPEPVMRVDLSGKILYANPASQAILDAWQRNVGRKVPDEWIVICVRIIETGEIEEHEMLVGERIFLMSLTAIKGADYLNIYARDVTEKKQAENSLSYQATHDQLTGLKNRYYFEREVTLGLEKIHLENKKGVLLYIDLDQFKIVNDTGGHVAGDELLRQLAGLLSEGIRERDILARLGGDEFGLFLADCSVEKGLEIAEKLLRIINDFLFVWEEHSFHVGGSIGVVGLDAGSQGLAEVLGAADVACYAAKDAGRNQVYLYRMDDETTSRHKNEMHWAALIPEALSENRFVLMGQLITPLQDEQRHGHYEILLRLRGPDGEMVPPGAFIPAAERYNLMASIDFWVVQQTMEFIEQLTAQGKMHEGLSFAINLSGESLSRKSLLKSIGELIKKHNILPGQISFEVTETAAISQLTLAVDFIRELKKLGCRFALDDFGSGLSSFAYLKNLPVDYLKIDGAFVRDILDDPIDEAMVESINQIGHVMKIETIAEFAESDEIIERLREIGVDYAQGFGVHKPTLLKELFI